MSFELTKWLSLLLFPLQQVVLMLIFALAALWWGWRGLGASLIGLALCWLYLCASPLMADYMMARLEADYPPQAATDLPAAAAIVVLGGSTRGDTAVQQFSDLNAQSDRLIFAAELYHQGKAPLVLLSGGSVGHLRSEAREMADIMAIMQLPPANLLLEERSRNTYENALYSASLLKKNNINRVLLVTSAFHMSRAVACFTQQGIEVIPAATDYQVLRHDDLLPDLLPSLSALSRTTYAIREMVGSLIYSLRGYL
ncbi:MAG: YdcF family protein [Parahaliea sp.]